MKGFLFISSLFIFTWVNFVSLESQEEVATIISPKPSITMAYEKNVNVINNFFEFFQNNDNQKLSSILAHDYHLVNIGDLQDASYSRFTEMSKNLKVRMTALHKALPDFKLSVDEILADGDKVIAKITLSGVQRGVFLGIAPTNKPIHIKIVDIFTIQDGKILHIAEMWNELSVMKQLGYILL